MRHQPLTLFRDDLSYNVQLFILAGVCLCALTTLAVTNIFWERYFVFQYADTPYCEETSIVDRTYKRCWIAREVDPPVDPRKAAEVTP